MNHKRYAKYLTDHPKYGAEGCVAGGTHELGRPDSALAK